MGEIILNGRSYNNGTKYLEVTQAQYNALPANKLTDGTLYCITDAPGPGEGFPPMIYSYEEREVGVWVDGKPLYQKTFVLNQEVTLNTWTNNILGTKDSGIQIKHVNGYYSVPNYTRYSNFSYYRGSNEFVSFCINATDDDVNFRSNMGLTTTIVDITIQYTKTTDTPGSGTWTTQGAIAHHYSTDEHIIGTWIDGKPLYEKTITVSSSSISGSENTIAHGISNVDNIFFVEGCMMRSGNLSLPLVTYHTASSWACSIYNLTRTNFILYLGSDEQSRVQTIYITLRYTKTTD